MVEKTNQKDLVITVGSKMTCPKWHFGQVGHWNKKNHTWAFFLLKFLVKKVMKFFLVIDVTTQIIPTHATCTMVPECGNPIINVVETSPYGIPFNMGTYNISPITSPIAYCTCVPPKTPPSTNFPHNTPQGVPISRFVSCVKAPILSFQ
jgi:hypothetical protein